MVEAAFLSTQVAISSDWSPENDRQIKSICVTV